MDDVCSGCTRDHYLKDFKGFKAGLATAKHMSSFKSERDAYDHWKEKRKFKKKLKGHL